MTRTDPWALLGIPPGASVADARLARRLLAKRLHPDVYLGDSPGERAERSAQMVLVNRALSEIEAAGHEPRARPAPEATDTSGADSRQPGQDHPHPAAEPIEGDSFTVDGLPAETFEALYLVGYGLGDILSTEEPYRLELYLTEPVPCFCQLTLVPEAGGSLVTIDIESAADSAEPPPAWSVRDVLVAGLNRLAPGG